MSISDVQLKSNYYGIFDGKGKKIKDLHSSVGDLLGYGDDFIIFENGSYYDVYDDKGKRIKSLSVSSLGKFKAASGKTMVFKKGNYFETYDVNGKKLNTRSA